MAYSKQHGRPYSLRSTLQPTSKDSGFIVRSQKMRRLTEGSLHRSSFQNRGQRGSAKKLPHSRRAPAKSPLENPEPPLQVCAADSVYLQQETVNQDAVDFTSILAQGDAHNMVPNDSNDGSPNTVSRDAVGDDLHAPFSDNNSPAPDSFDDPHSQTEPVSTLPRLSSALQKVVQEAFGIINERFFQLSQATKLEKEQIINMWFEESRIPSKRFGNSWNNYLAYFRANRKEELDATFHDTGHSTQ